MRCMRAEAAQRMPRPMPACACTVFGVLTDADPATLLCLQCAQSSTGRRFKPRLLWCRRR